MLIFSFWLHPTVIIFLHEHLHVIPNFPIKFHQKPLNSLGGVALTRCWSSKNLYLDYLPLQSFNSNYISSCTSTYDTQLSFKITSKPNEGFRKSCTKKKNVERWTDRETNGWFQYTLQTLLAGVIINLFCKKGLQHNSKRNTLTTESSKSV